LLYSKSSVRAVLRKLTAWTLAGSLIGGLLLPIFARSAAADPDGVCGPYVVLEHSVQHFEAPLDAPTDHCVLCHYWHAIAGASVAGAASLLPPDVPLSDNARGRAAFVPLSDRTQTPLRGPPSPA
jgi:hypothetical protein